MMIALLKLPVIYEHILMFFWWIILSQRHFFWLALFYILDDCFYLLLIWLFHGLKSNNTIVMEESNCITVFKKGKIPKRFPTICHTHIIMSIWSSIAFSYHIKYFSVIKNERATCR